MLTPEVLDMNFWLIVMALGVGGMILFSSNYTIPEITLQNLHPKGTPIWPVMFISVATFMSAVSCTYILMAEEGMRLSTLAAYSIGILFAAGCLGMFTYNCI